MPVQKITPIRPPKPQEGQVFNPYKKFNGILIPEAIARNPDLPPGAKLVYGRLCRYAGQQGMCYPAVDTLAKEVGLKVRQTRYHIKLLIKKRFLQKTDRTLPDGRTRTSNLYMFLWHSSFGPYRGCN
jgi:hypothetical protein